MRTNIIKTNPIYREYISAPYICAYAITMTIVKTIKGRPFAVGRQSGLCIQNQH